MKIDRFGRAGVAARAIPFLVAGALTLASPSAGAAQSPDGERALLNTSVHAASVTATRPGRISGERALLGHTGGRAAATAAARGRAPVSPRRALLGSAPEARPELRASHGD